MSNRIAQIIILAEDQEHQMLVRRYLIHTGHERRSFRFLPLPANRRCGSQFVRERFAEQVKECRGMLARGASNLLIVITDADNLKTTEREQNLQAELAKLGNDAVDTNEPIVILIPKWNVETWVKCLLGQSMDEENRDSDRPPVTREQITTAAAILFAWARHNAQPGGTCVASLNAALPRWRKIG